jgi:hypothetical protein
MIAGLAMIGKVGGNPAHRAHISPALAAPFTAVLDGVHSDYRSRPRVVSGTA